MADLGVDIELLQRFEEGFDPQHPERGAIPARVLGYGEISTVLALEAEGGAGLAYKRLAMFHTQEEAAAYQALYGRYVRALEDRIGVRLVPSETVRLRAGASGRVVVYIVQAQMPDQALGHRAIHWLEPKEVPRLVQAVLQEGEKVFRFNEEHRGALELGVDMQISNWALAGLDVEQPALGDRVELLYLDTSTPMMRVAGRERLDPELFLRSAPSFLVWILRLLFLDEVMTRYYDRRLVVVDLLANFYKEQRPEAVPELVQVANQFYAEALGAGGWEPLTEREVRAYYREDAWIWRLYLAFRRVDRRMHRLVGKEYPYVLPGKIQR
jgi:hypothetical protein